MRRLALGLAAILLTTGAQEIEANPSAIWTIWVAEFGETTSQWCAYRDEATWKALEHANSAGSITLSNHGTAIVDITWGSPSGDWLVTDHYAFTPNDFGRMTRKGGDATFQTYLDAEYSLNGGGEPTPIKSWHRRWEGKQKPSQPWSRDVPLYTSAAKFPFYDIAARLHGRPDLDRLCTPAT